MRGGLFLDLDGTLADSLPIMRTVYRGFLARFGKTGSDSEFERLNGPPLPEIVAALARVHGIDAPPASLIRIYDRLVEDTYRDVAPRAGAADLLRLARARAMPVGVVTSNSSRLARTWCRATGLESAVNVIVGREEFRRGKPDAEPYLIALKRTGCTASASLAVEDSATGARSALAAGIPTLLLAEPDVAAPPGIFGRINGLESVVEVLEGQPVQARVPA